MAGGEQFNAADLVPHLRRELEQCKKRTCWAYTYEGGGRMASDEVRVFADHHATRHPHRTPAAVYRQVRRILAGDVTRIGIEWADELSMSCGLHMCDVWEDQYLAPGYAALEDELAGVAA